MPAKNALKLYVADGYYHLYNRGVEKRDIFLDKRDYKVFLHFLKMCLSPKPPTDPSRINPFPYKNLHGSVDLLCFVLMPNHFHLFVYQKIQNGIEMLMRSILTRYVAYFNHRCQRQGHLFQGRYKAIQIEGESYFLHLSRYIHINPLEIWNGSLADYPYSSYPYYLGKRHAEWVHPEPVLSFFGKTQKRLFSSIRSYKSFVEDYISTLEVPGDIQIEE